MNKYIKIRKITILGALTFFLSSCSGDFLDREPLDQISSDSFWNTQVDAEMALAGVYSRLNVRTFMFPQSYYAVLAGEASGNLQDLARGQIEATSGGIIDEIFRDCYRGISSCNFFLENIDKVSMTADLKSQYKAEVLFLRALFYFTLSDFYGGVPLYTQTVTADEAKVKQSTKADVVAQVIADLDVAIASLPNTDYSSTGHAVKGSALALKSRVLLYQEDWPAAAAAANQLITDNQFSLYGNFENIFLTQGQEGNPEIIFSTRFLNPDNSSQQDIQLEWWATVHPLQQLVDAFECTDGQPITTSPLYDSSNFKLNRDPRMLLTLKLYSDPAVKASGEVIGYDYNTSELTGYMLDKFVDVEVLPIDYSVKSEQDWVLIRYAEVLLNYAEAKNEVSGPDASVYDAVNTIRARPGINMPPLPAGLNQDQMRERIRQERRVELALEGLRYGDIKRWKTAETYIPSIVDNATGLNRAFNPSKNYVFPFPQSEIDRNPELVQNPGY